METKSPRLERTEVAQRDFETHINEEKMLVDVVVNQVQHELGLTIRKEPNITPDQIISMARERFIDLLSRDLLSEREANKCFRRFTEMVYYYYGS